MEKINLDIKHSNERVEISFSPCSNVSTTVYCTTYELKRYYKVNNINEISPTLVRKMISDGRFQTINRNLFHSEVNIYQTKDKNFSIQVEDNLAVIQKKDTSEELWVIKDKIADLWKFSKKDWNKLKKEKDEKKLIPLNNNLVSNANDFKFSFE